MGTSRVVLITGGSSGIGAACVRLLVSRGWKVSVFALPDSNLDRIGELDVLVNSGDVTSHEACERTFERTLAHYGCIDVLVNSAGVGLYAAPTEIPLPLFSRLLHINAVAPLALAQMAIPIMRRRGSGTIVNIGSVAGSVALPWAAAYSASKFALNAVHDSLRRELRGDCIHLVKVCPGIVDTGFRNHVLAGLPPPTVERIRKVVSPEAVAMRILSAIERRRHTVYVPRIGALFTLLDAVAPWLMDLYLSRFLAAKGHVNLSSNRMGAMSNDEAA